MNLPTSVALNDILLPIRAYLDQVDAEVSASLVTGVPLIDDVASFVYSSQGKKIRASILILASGIHGGIPDGVVKLAAGAEVVHAASLMHDDVIDSATLRRGRPTVSQKWGGRIAVLMGDYMLTGALNAALELERPDLYPVMMSAARAMVKGELCQIKYAQPHDITEERYFEIIELKTARFLSTCAYIGAAYSRLSPDETDALAQYGLNIGFAFQIIDDLLDFFDESNTGKDVGRDFMERKMTLPLLALYKRIDGSDRRFFEKCFAQPDDDGWQWVKAQAHSSGAVEYCRKRAEKYVEDAAGYLDGFAPSPCRETLRHLGRFVLDRDH